VPTVTVVSAVPFAQPHPTHGFGLVPFGETGDHRPRAGNGIADRWQLERCGV
jgi:hypothetical protein